MATVREVWDRLEFVRALVSENPIEGRKAADAALALLAEVEDPPPDLLAFAAQIDGTAWRANGKYAGAVRCYTRAASIYRDALNAFQDLALRRRLILGRADLWRRWSFLCMELQEWDRGLEMLDSAEKRFLVAGQQHEVGRVYLARGHLLWERNELGDQDQALVLLCRAVELIDPRKSEGAFRAATHNCTEALTLHPNPASESLRRGFDALRRGRLSQSAKRRSSCNRARQRFGHAERTVPDAKRRFLQGKILLHLHRAAEAQPFLETARIDLMLLGNYPRDVFAVTLELAECYLAQFRRPWKRVGDLLAETFALCPSGAIGPEVQDALDLLQAALETRNLPVARNHLVMARRRYAGE